MTSTQNGGAVSERLSIGVRVLDEETIREFRLNAGGVFVGPALSAFQGALTGVPTYTGAPSPLLGKDGRLAGS